ncbi:MAG TPA: hypothetical protein VL131_06210 [Gammaproteobacteria bacterium]|nr:hypothetical protein [Gammaproteobacteria bacterium]
MSGRMLELEERRAMLLVRAAVQRREIAREVDAVEQRLRSVDHWLAVGRDVLRHPAVIGAGLLALVLLGRTRALRLLGQAVLIASGVRGLLRSATKIL